MALESATTINQLVPTNPTGADAKGQGDDHLRLIKSTLKNTFPNIAGVVNATHTQLNQLTTPNLFVQSGMIVLWAGSLGSLPPGWLLCNGVGSVSGGIPVPDLRNRFVVGSGQAYGQHQTGGSSTHTHSVFVTINPHALTVDEMPPHNHDFFWNNNPTTSVQPGIGGAMIEFTNPASFARTDTGHIGSRGSGAAHTHSNAANLGAPVDHLPPWYALAYIIKS